jgi:hypothetical protein
MANKCDSPKERGHVNTATEYPYGRRFQARLLDLAQTFKKSDTLPSLDGLRPHF